jgi:sec-independent protein translocase protein TatA
MGISIWQLLIILVIVILLFGTKRLKGLGGDLGGAIKGFRGAIKDGEGEGTPGQEKGETIEGEVTSKERDES